MTRKPLLFGIAAVAAVALACGEQASTPTAPTPAVSSDTAAAAADGSTLKATAPAPQQPANASTTDSLAPNLIVANATLKHLGDVALAGTMQYRFVVETIGGGVGPQRPDRSRGRTHGIARAARHSAGGYGVPLARSGRDGRIGRAVVGLLDVHHAEVRGLAGVLPDRDGALRQPDRRQDDRHAGGRRAVRARQGRPPSGVRIARDLHPAEHADVGVHRVPGRGARVRFERRQDESRQHAAGIFRPHRQPVPLQR